ncbi:DUF1294 domain-containing protein [Paenibacillus sp. SYP-B4298]|uniref:DUF1294 domain-containing protein n=1 Tax=Paenibacillus sp. SYP-B4298 TaxID=2996034 RepID=UPI0022DDF105|nr:DUF1294 domain-containing protein [Paenibacillus sp. SYP-B4298]
MLMRHDKLQAGRRGRRVPERTLLGLAALGGAAGGWLGMKLWRHKTRHGRFRFGLPLLTATHAMVIIMLFLFRQM